MMFREMKGITLNQSSRAFRVAGDGMFAAIYNAQGTGEAYIEIHTLDSDAQPQRIPSYHAKSKFPEYVLTPLFDISPSGRFVAVAFRFYIAESVAAMRFFVWDNAQAVFLPPFILDAGRYNKAWTAFGVDGQGGNDIITLRFENDTRLVSVTSSGEVVVWSIAQSKILRFIGAAAHHAHSVALGFNTGVFAIIEDIKKTLRGQIGRVYTAEGAAIYDVLEGFHERVIVSEDLQLGRFFRLWNIYSGSLIRTFEDVDRVAWKSPIVFSQDELLLAGVIDSHQTVVWNVNTGESIYILPEETTPIGFTSDNKYLVVQLGTNRIGIWHFALDDWDVIHSFEGMIIAAQLVDSHQLSVMVCRDNECNLQHMVINM